MLRILNLTAGKWATSAIFLGVVTGVGYFPQSSQAAGDKPAVFEVHLPADAQLQVDDTLTQSTGEVRRFESPPLAEGKKYTYTLKATWNGKEVVHPVEVDLDKVVVVDLQPDFKKNETAPSQPTETLSNKDPLAKPGFVTAVKDGRLWVFKEGSKELDDYKKTGEPEKSVTRISAGPKGMTIKAPDRETIDAYLKAASK